MSAILVKITTGAQVIR